MVKLRRKAGTENDIYYFQSRNAEADFVVCDGNKTLAVYQVSYDISNEKTRKREIRGCIAGAKATRCDNLFLITDHESETIEKILFKHCGEVIDVLLGIYAVCLRYKLLTHSTISAPSGAPIFWRAVVFRI